MNTPKLKSFIKHGHRVTITLSPNILTIWVSPKWVWTLKISSFWQIWIKKSYKISKNPLNVVIGIRTKIYWILPDTLWYSTTVTMLMHMILSLYTCMPVFVYVKPWLGIISWKAKIWTSIKNVHTLHYNLKISPFNRATGFCLRFR